MERKIIVNGQNIIITDLKFEGDLVSFMFRDKEYNIKKSSQDGGFISLLEDEQEYNCFVSQETNGQRHIVMDSMDAFVSILSERRKKSQEVKKGSLSAPMPGTVIKVHVKKGDLVKKGDVLVEMEAMKLQHTIKAPEDGKIKDIYFPEKSQVQEGDILLRIKNAK